MSNYWFLAGGGGGSNPATANLITNGQFFGLDNGQPFTAIQCSDFNLLNRFQHGEDINPILAQRAAVGFNMLRVWTAFDIPGIGAYLDIDYTRIPAFVALAASYGIYVEFTGYTGVNDPLHWNRLCEASRNCSPRPIDELVNELDQNLNEMDSEERWMVRDTGIWQHHSDNTVTEIHPPFTQPFGLLSAHGSNGSQHEPVLPHWSYATFHTNDAPEWWRKVGHNAMEIWGGPTLSNENTRYDHDPDLKHAEDAAEGGTLLAAGSCCHTTAGKTSTLWSGNELEWAEAWARGARSVNLGCQSGPYVHRIDLEGPEDLRVYERPTNGLDCVVRIRV